MIKRTAIINAVTVNVRVNGVCLFILASPFICHKELLHLINGLSLNAANANTLPQRILFFVQSATSHPFGT